MITHGFTCQGCKGTYDVDEATFNRFITDELQAKLSERTRGDGNFVATLEFETKCPKCTPKGESTRTLKVTRLQ